jgi:hypothetical protein
MMTAEQRSEAARKAVATRRANATVAARVAEFRAKPKAPAPAPQWAMTRPDLIPPGPMAWPDPLGGRFPGGACVLPTIEPLPDLPARTVDHGPVCFSVRWVEDPLMTDSDRKAQDKRREKVRAMLDKKSQRLLLVRTDERGFAHFTTES